MQCLQKHFSFPVTSFRRNGIEYDGRFERRQAGCDLEKLGINHRQGVYRSINHYKSIFWTINNCKGIFGTIDNCKGLHFQISGGTAKAASGSSSSSSSKISSVAAVQQATTNFAKDANTVSASLNQLPDETSAANIKSLATTAFNAESDEDARRSVLAAAAESAGSSSNTKIVQNNPTVLKGLKAIMQKPTAATVKSNVATIQISKNPNILPSITQLSNSALKAVGSTMTQQRFPATGQ
ncbi:hypothetical protein NA56DRAFT_695776 [Hyaloscypha hepaticicola]|uniref:Uncharacterized protein n=1 Tax=Hyaloscypha hepaticicola TaxID=2082293 RepID=A0A2J6PDA2_9HELO|nr:hypothetical protein NA56DRAFT_695776 [Hyaloscypha hepaticicola]